MPKRTFPINSGPRPKTLRVHVGLTGAREGDMLAGTTADTMHVLLRVHSGHVLAPTCWTEEAEALWSREELLEALARHAGIFGADWRVETEALMAARPTVAGVNHLPMGASCHHNIHLDCDCPATATFTVVCQGQWQEFADHHGHGQELQYIVDGQTPVTWRQILALFRTKGQSSGPGGAVNKDLLLRTTLYKVVPGPRPIAPGAPAISGLLAGPSPTDQTYELAGMVVRVPASAGARFAQVEEVAADVLAVGAAATGAAATGAAVGAAATGAAVGAAATGAAVGAAATGAAVGAAATGAAVGAAATGAAVGAAEVPRCRDRLSRLTGGALKSLVQKCLRFQAVSVDLEDGGPLVPTETVAVFALLLLFASPGTFSPELQLYTRGCTAALKRLAVILEEDCWVEARPVAQLMALALATQRMPEYHPPTTVVRAAAELVVRACRSPAIVAWRGGPAPTTLLLAPAEVQALQDAAALLRTLRSFAGDMDMADKVAELASNRLPLLFSPGRPAVMPVWHAVDQHTWRGVGHPMDNRPFSQLFARVFNQCTGLNPRLGPVDLSAVDDVRFAQWCCGSAVLGDRTPAPVAVGPPTVLAVPLDSGVLAAGVGPIAVLVRAGDRSVHLLVLLGLNRPEDEVVMFPPSRDPKDLFSKVTEEQRGLAIEEARSRSRPLNSPLLDETVAAFVDGEWAVGVGGQPWAVRQAQGGHVAVDTLEAGPALTPDNPTLRSILQHSWPVAVVEDAERLVTELAQRCPVPDVLRAVSLMTQQWSKVKMPTPALNGGLGSDQLAAYEGDGRVWRLLVLLSRLVPAALRPTTVPNFDVPVPIALRRLEEWLLRAVRLGGAVANTWPGRWPTIADCDARLMEHQRAAVHRMLERDQQADTGHFLVMDTGLGKTVTSLVYAHRWLCLHGGAVRHVVWVTPKNTPTNLIRQLRETWGVPVHLVPRVSAAAKPAKGQTRRVDLLPWAINVIEADHLRTAIDRGLADAAPRCFGIFDEVDEMYADTLRTSAARRLARLFSKFVAQTATLLRKNEKQLCDWLADTCPFPVDGSNMLVAASAMVAMQLDLGITRSETVERLPITDDLRAELRGMAGGRDWAGMARVVRRATDPGLVDRAVREALRDRQTWPRGGTLLVGESRDHVLALIDACNAGGLVLAGGFDTLELPSAGDYGVVVVPKHLVRSYNSAVRLGAMVTGVYPGNAAERHQLRGRLCRISQKRKEVAFTTVFVENTILDLLHRRHSSIDTMNITLQQLGEQFAESVLAPLR
jgi:hypothetical protein